jgi:membrane peptidoglycan carboxypeptidase
MGADDAGTVHIDLSSEAGSTPEPRRPRRWRRRLLVAGVIVVMLSGVGVIGATYFVDSIPPPQLRSVPASTTLYYSDGSVLARIGPVDATPLRPGEITEEVKQVAVAAEDPDFWHSWAGPITRAVVRQGTDLSGTNTAAKARLAVQAWRLDQELGKEEILAYYLNATPFGRRAYGIEAAARAYYGKSARTDAPPEIRISTAEAMVLMAMVRQPNPDPADPTGRPGFDPSVGAVAAANSHQRWVEIRDSMVSAGYLSTRDADRLAYSTPLNPAAMPYQNPGRLAPAGLVVNHVLDEITHAEGSTLRGKTWADVEAGGYSITTTLDPRAQAAIEGHADESREGSVMNGQPEALQAAGVVVEPGTGRVLAYFGGHDGLGNDYASVYTSERGETVGVGRHPPGGTFTAYTLAAALKAGISLRSRWRWTPHEQAGRTTDNPIRNAGTCPSDTVGPAAVTGACTLLESTTASLNVPFYDVTLSTTPTAVLTMARDLGIDAMWNDLGVRQDLLSASNLSSLVPSQFDTILGLGQYPVTVLDQANAMATLAAGGRRAHAHFVRDVRRADQVVYAETLPGANLPPVLAPAHSADLSYALRGDTDLALKTGVWEFAGRPDQNAHAWSIGYTSSLAVAVWVGNRVAEAPLLTRDGTTVWGSGLPTQILRGALADTQSALNLTAAPFPAPVFAGSENPPLSVPA